MRDEKKRGRPRAFDAQAALGKARDVFWDRGFTAASLDNLSAATNLNRPSLYGAF
ncbi:MAG: TetR family transcriptional regulator, partial [Rhizobium leguminosarum]|nr:TetR family transcriptional regulator [Rhizobium leguminosarum]